MSYETFFTSKFAQGQAMDMALSVSGKDKGNLAAERDGVCQTLTLLWLSKTKTQGADEAFKFVAGKRGDKASQGFYRQIMGAQRDSAMSGDRAASLTNLFQLLSGGSGAGSLTLETTTSSPATLTTFLNAQKNILCYVRLVFRAGGHATAASMSNGAWVFFDPNCGQAVDLLGMGPGIQQLFTDCISFYASFNFVEFQVYKVN